MSSTNFPDYINRMYDSSLASQKETLDQDYQQNVANLDEEQRKSQKQTDANLTRTYVEAAKNQKSYNEVQNAYGLTSGAMAQARLAQNNQLQSNMTTIRAAQQETDAEIERQRNILAKEYASAIAKAQADNDLQRAQALYEAAKEDDDKLLQQQKEAASLMAGAGDYSLYAALYGLTDEQVAKLQGTVGASGGGYSSDGSDGGPGSPLPVTTAPTYSQIKAAYVDYANSGATKDEKNAILNNAVNDGYITSSEASRIAAIYSTPTKSYTAADQMWDRHGG